MRHHRNHKTKYPRQCSGDAPVADAMTASRFARLRTPRSSPRLHGRRERRLHAAMLRRRSGTERPGSFGRESPGLSLPRLGPPGLLARHGRRDKPHPDLIFRGVDEAAPPLDVTAQDQQKFVGKTAGISRVQPRPGLRNVEQGAGDRRAGVMQCHSLHNALDFPAGIFTSFRHDGLP